MKTTKKKEEEDENDEEEDDLQNNMLKDWNGFNFQISTCAFED